MRRAAREKIKESGNGVQVANGRLADDYKAEESPQSTYLKMSHHQSKARCPLSSAQVLRPLKELVRSTPLMTLVLRSLKSKSKVLHCWLICCHHGKGWCNVAHHMLDWCTPQRDRVLDQLPHCKPLLISVIPQKLLLKNWRPTTSERMSEAPVCTPVSQRTKDAVAQIDTTNGSFSLVHLAWVSKRK